MKTFRIIESRPATYYWEYEIEANSETEALNKLLDGEVDSDEAWCDVNNDEDVDSEFEIYPADDDNNDGE